MSNPIPNPCKNPFVIISCVVDTTNMARNDAKVNINAPIRPTCLNDNLFKAIFAENPEKGNNIIKKMKINNLPNSYLQLNRLNM